MRQDRVNYIAVICEEGSITDAAKRLNISQPALSAQVRKIEDSFGIKIFDKNRRPLLLTEEGQRYLEFTQRMQMLEDGFMQEISDLRGMRTGRLRIGGTQSYTSTLLPPAVALFRERHPGIEIGVFNGSVQRLAEMCARRELDAFVATPGKRASGIVYESLLDTELLLCVPAGFEVNERLASYAFDVADARAQSEAEPIDFGELQGSTFAMLRDVQHMGMVLRKLFRDNDVEPDMLIRTDQALTAYALTTAGLAISLMYDEALRRLHPDERAGVCCYRVDDKVMRGPLSVAYPQGDPTKVVTEFINCLKEASWC